MSEKKQHIVKQLLFGVVLILMMIPVIHELTRGEGEDGELAGAIVPTEYKAFSWKSWFDQTYQKNTAKFLNEDFGYRPTFVRFHNQRLYTMFNMANAKNVVVGKEGYLYERNYIDAYYGSDFIGQESIQNRVKMLASIQNELSKKGKHLVVVLAPGKGSFFPEYIPEYLKPERSNITNLEYFRTQFDAQKINYLDFNSWFISKKGKMDYPLYPKCGVHWSKYGEYLVADSLIKYLGKKTDLSFPQLFLKEITTEETNRDGDYDIGEGMNLLTELDTYPMGYPKYSFGQSEVKGPKALVVADSYYWGLFNKGMSRDCFDGGQFWYYSHQIFPDSYNEPLKVKDVDIIKEVETNNVVILICTDANLHKFAFGFIDQLYEAYVKNRLKQD